MTAWERFLLLPMDMRWLLDRALEIGAAAGLFLGLSWSLQAADLAAAVGSGALAVSLAAGSRGREREAQGLRWRWLRFYRDLPWKAVREAVRVWGTLLRPAATGAWSRTADPRAKDPDAAHRALVVIAESTPASRIAVGLDPDEGVLVSHDLPARRDA